jgi:intraflagellar transport protein 80
MSMAFNNLIVTSFSKCYIYLDSNWNTPHIFDIKDKDSVSLIIQSPKLFVLVQIQNGVMIYNYDGRLISNPKISGTKCNLLINISP